MRGCNVFTRPSRISGAPVYADTCVTFTPAPAIALAVPPVERISKPSSLRTPASSTTPRLSETETNARRMPRGYHVLLVDDTEDERVHKLQHAERVMTVSPERIGDVGI